MRALRDSRVRRGAPAVLALAALLLLGVPRASRAQEVSSAEQAPREHQLMLYYPFGANVYLSQARTVGGLGGGIGLRDTLADRLLLQGDVSYLLGLRNVGMFRLGAGLQRRGIYEPAVLLTLTGLFGQAFNFLTPQHPTPIGIPALALGLNVAPARFMVNGTLVSLFELGVGVGTEFPGLGIQYHLQLVEIGTTF